uniref:exopolysaccharide biosynthesis protein n=1 Tax=Ningiella ruwaisensis TaxID=2364274 RepID=UPI001F4FF6FD|nr:exopolysaccharide biosynthesis protein [Ningiella ruwaisensis]
MKLTQVLKKMANDTKGETTTLNDVVAQLESRGFGPLLIAPALIALLPTGAIPSVPTLCALSIILITVQLMFGQQHPWLPKKLKEIEIQRDTLKQSVERFEPYTKRIDKVFKPRLSFLTNEIGKRLIAALASITALLMIPLEIVPFAAAIPAGAIVLLGLGLSTEDGLMSIFGVALSAVSVYIVYTQVLA